LTSRIAAQLCRGGVLRVKTTVSTPASSFGCRMVRLLGALQGMNLAQMIQNVAALDRV